MHMIIYPYWFHQDKLGAITKELSSFWIKLQNSARSASSVRNRVGLKGAARPHWALEVTSGKQEGTRCIQMSSNWGAPRGNLRFIYRTPYKQGTNVEKDAEWLHNGKMVVQSRSRGNDKGLTNLQHDRSSYQKWQLQQFASNLSFATPSPETFGNLEFGDGEQSAQQRSP